MAYLNSDTGKFAMQVEENLNELTGQNNDSAYREWHKEVERTEEIVKNSKRYAYFGVVFRSFLSAALQ